MKNNFSLPVTSVVGISLVAIWGGCDLKSVFAKNVNWNMIYLITGMGMYCTLATTMGVVTTLGDKLQAMPAIFIAPAICLIGALLSFVTSASTVQPLLFAMIPALATAAGCSMEAMVVPMMIGVGITSMSPVSTGGALCLIGVPEEVSGKLFNKMLITAVVCMIVCVLLCFTPIFRIGA
jgi:di/tricarboxylate transporter